MLARHNADGLHDRQCEWYPDGEYATFTFFGLYFNRAANLLDFIVHNIHADPAACQGRDRLGCGKTTIENKLL